MLLSAVNSRASFAVRQTCRRGAAYRNGSRTCCYTQHEQVACRDHEVSLNPVVLDKGNYRMPDKVVVGEPLKRPAVAAAPTRGTMGPPPPGPLKKQKR
jgi:hypothetical protein